MDDYQHDDCEEDDEDYAAYEHHYLHVHVTADLSGNALFSGVSVGYHYLLDLFAVLDQILNGCCWCSHVVLNEVALVLGLAHAAVDTDRVVDEG